MSKKRILNIKPQEIVTDGRRSVQFRGSDGKMHALAGGESGGSQDGSGASPATAHSFSLRNAYVIATSSTDDSAKPYRLVNGELIEVTVQELADALIQDPSQPVIIKGSWNSNNTPLARVVNLQRSTEEETYLTEFEIIKLRCVEGDFDYNIGIILKDNRIMYNLIK